MQISDCTFRIELQTADFCREIETYLCKKNDGHLIRVVGPSFDLVSRWAELGVPLKVAFAGIDRYFERYYRKGPRRRPVKIDFCDADVLDVFDEWRRAVGLRQVESQQADSQQVGPSNPQPPIQNPHSLPAHLERAVVQLTSARANGVVDAAFDSLIDRVSSELDNARATAGGLRGEARRDMITRLAALDAELLEAAAHLLEPATVAAIGREADEELAPFRGGMPPDAYARARQSAIDRLVRERLRLPVIAYE